MKTASRVKTEHETRLAILEMLPSANMIAILGACYSSTKFMLPSVMSDTLIINEHLFIKIGLLFVIKAPLIILAVNIWYTLFYFFQGTSGRELLWWTILMCIVTNVSSIVDLVDVANSINLLGGANGG